MAKGGRPRSSDKLQIVLQIRLRQSEVQAFQKAAEIAGIPLSTWGRERLRRASVKELERSGIIAPFLLDAASLGDTDVSE